MPRLLDFLACCLGRVRRRSQSLPAPRGPLADDEVALRLPKLSDAATLQAYAAEASGLSGIWAPLRECAGIESCQALIRDWLAGWQNRPSRQGPALIIERRGDARLLGQIGFEDRGGKLVELVYGIAPAERGHGYASRAARLAALWLLDEGLADEVELRIGQDNIESQRVAAKAGFAPAGTVISHVEAPGESYQDLRFAMSRPV